MVRRRREITKTYRRRAGLGRGGSRQREQGDHEDEAPSSGTHSGGREQAQRLRLFLKRETMVGTPEFRPFYAVRLHPDPPES